MRGLNYYFERLTRMIEDWKLILALSSKPDQEEFKVVLKVVGLATLIIAVIAYIIRVAVVLTLYG